MSNQIIKKRLKYYQELISHHGKFESEPIYVPYFWQEVVETEEFEDVIPESYETNWLNIYVCAVTQEALDLFQELRQANYGDLDFVFLYENEQGFVREFDQEIGYEIMGMPN